jgi:hypothetical protein
VPASRLLLRGFIVLGLALGLSACGSGKPENQYEWAAVRLVEGFGKNIKVRSVKCSNVRQGSSTCTLTDTTGTTYSCAIALQNSTYTKSGCFWSRGGGGGPP